MACLSLCLSAMPCLCSCHAMSSPGGLRDLTDRSASDAHINMTYVPYLHPAAVGPFRFAGYRILHLHLHGILHGMAVYGMYVCGEHAICPRLPREDAVLLSTMPLPLRLVFVSMCVRAGCLYEMAELCSRLLASSSSSKQPRVAAMQAGCSRPCHCQKQLRGRSKPLSACRNAKRRSPLQASDLVPTISSPGT